LAAAELAELDSYKTTNYPRYKRDFEDSFKGFPFMSMKENMMEKEMGEANYKIYREVQKMSQLEGIQMLLPYEIDIK